MKNTLKILSAVVFAVAISNTAILSLSPTIVFGHMLNDSHGNEQYHGEVVNADEGPHFHKHRDDKWHTVDPNDPTLDSCVYRSMGDNLRELREYLIRKHSQWCSLGARYEGLCNDIRPCMEWTDKCKNHSDPDLRCTHKSNMSPEDSRAAIFL